jgi:membrane protease YdiL (CAAX protease family)
MYVGTDPSPTSKLARQRERGVLVRRVTSWIGLQSGCVPAVLASAALFALVHVGKDWRELLLSVPGGIVLAYMAYRTNTWLVPFVLHLATAGTACAMAILMER